MSYTKTTWTNSTGQPISAFNLNHIEQGILESHNTWLGSLSNLRALDGSISVAVGDVRHVRGYATNGDGGEGSFANYGVSDTDTDNDGTVIVDSVGRRWKRLGIKGDWKFAWFGVLPTATDTQNTTRIQNTLTAASGATDYMGGATCFFGAGQYSVSGGITVPHNTRVKGLGTTHTLINHTGNNVLFESLQNYGDGRVLMRRMVAGMQIIGNSGSTAKAIHYGNFAHGAKFEDLLIWQYTGGTGTAGGVGFHIENTLSFSEGLTLRDVHLRGCRINAALTMSGTGQSSFSDPRFQNVLSVATGITGTALYIGDGCDAYFGFWNMKLHLETANSVGIRLGPGSRMRGGTFNVGFEIWDPTAKAIQSTGAAEISGKGTFDPQIGSGVDGNNNPYFDISNQTKLYIEDHPGDLLISGNPGSAVWWHIYTIPASSAASAERLMVEVKGGPSWGVGTLTHDKFMFQRRDGFGYRYMRSGADPNASRGQMAVRAYEQTDGSVAVFVWAAIGSFTMAQVRAEAYATYENILGGPRMTPLPLKNARQTTPAEVTAAVGGGPIFDSSSSSFPPNWEHDGGYIYSNGKPLGGPTGTPTVALGAGGGVGSGGTASIAAGSDSKSGRISITTGSAPSPSSVLLTVTFPTAYPQIPKTVMIASASATASQSNAWPFVDYSTLSTTQFQLRIGTAAINVSQAQEWLYQVL